MSHRQILGVYVLLSQEAEIGLTKTTSQKKNETLSRAKI